MNTDGSSANAFDYLTLITLLASFILYLHEEISSLINMLDHKIQMERIKEIK